MLALALVTALAQEEPRYAAGSEGTIDSQNLSRLFVPVCVRSSQWLEEVVLDGCATLWGFTLTHPRLRRISLLGCNGLKEVSAPLAPSFDAVRWRQWSADIKRLCALPLLCTIDFNMGCAR